jgi:ABC-type phosphate transport system permease subunit
VTTGRISARVRDEVADGSAAVSIEGIVLGDRIYRIAITAFALCVPLLLGLIAFEVGRAGWPAIRQFGLSFLTSDTWDPVAGVFGAGPAIAGTLLCHQTTGLSTAAGPPCG